MRLRPLALALLVCASSFAVAQEEDAPISDSMARVEMARAMRADARLREAIVEYRKVLAAEPGNATAACELAQTLVWNHENAEAAKILAGIPENKLTPAGLEAAADLSIDSGKFEDALAKLRALEKTQPSPKVRYRIASVLTWLKKYDEALPIYEELLKQAPGDVQLRRRYAQTLGWAGRNREAAGQWEISLKPGQ